MINQTSCELQIHFVTNQLMVSGGNIYCIINYRFSTESDQSLRNSLTSESYVSVFDSSRDKRWFTAAYDLEPVPAVTTATGWTRRLRRTAKDLERRGFAPDVSL